MWLGKITRNLALDRWRASRAGKRGGGQLEALLSELEGCLPAGDSPGGGPWMMAPHIQVAQQSPALYRPGMLEAQVRSTGQSPADCS